MKKLTASLCDKTFNSITVDSDTSTSGMIDFCYIKSRNEANRKVIDNEIMMQNVRINYEGTGIRYSQRWREQKLIEYQIVGATNDKVQKILTFSIANSPLVKTAVAGETLIGKIIMAIGKSGEKIDQEKIKIFWSMFNYKKWKSLFRI